MISLRAERKDSSQLTVQIPLFLTLPILSSMLKMTDCLARFLCQLYVRSFQRKIQSLRDQKVSEREWSHFWFTPILLAPSLSVCLSLSLFTSSFNDFKNCGGRGQRELALEQKSDFLGRNMIFRVPAQGERHSLWWEVINALADEQCAHSRLWLPGKQWKFMFAFPQLHDSCVLSFWGQQRLFPHTYECRCTNLYFEIDYQWGAYIGLRVLGYTSQSSLFKQSK